MVENNVIEWLQHAPTFNQNLTSDMSTSNPNLKQKLPPAEHVFSSPNEEETDAGALSPVTEVEPEPGLGGNPVRCKQPGSHSDLLNHLLISMFLVFESL